MSSYIIQGSSGNSNLAKIECLVENIKVIDNQADFQLMIKDDSDWNNHIENVCRSYGFKVPHNPIIYKNNGELIGSYKDFLNWTQSNYQIDESIVDSLYRNSTINQQISQQQMKLQKKIINNEQNLIEKLILKVQEGLDKGHIEKIRGNFENEIINGVQYYYKYDKSIQIKYDVPKEVSSEFIVPKQEVDDFNMEQIYNQDSITKEEQMKNEMLQRKSMKNTLIQQQQQPCDDKTKKPAKTANNQKESAVAEEKEQTQSKDHTQSQEKEQNDNKNVDNHSQVQSHMETNKEAGAESEMGKTGSVFYANKDESQMANSEQQILTQEKFMNYKENDASVEIDKDDNFDSDLEKNSYTYQDNNDYEECIIEMMGKRVLSNYVVQQYDNGYALALNPKPQIYGQCQLVFNQKQDLVLDLSQRVTWTQCNNKVEKGQATSYLNEQVINPFEPLTETDLEMMNKVNQELDSVAVYQILPNQSQNLLKDQSRVVHVIPMIFLQESLDNVGFDRLRNFQLKDQIELFRYNQNLFHQKLQSSAEEVSYPKKQKLRRMISRVKSKKTQISQENEQQNPEQQNQEQQNQEQKQEDQKQEEQKQEEQKEQEQKQEEQKYELNVDGHKVEEIEEKKKKKRYERERLTFYRNSQLEHMHLIGKLDSTMDGEKMRQMIRNMMMCLLRNYGVEISAVGLNLVISQQYIYVSVFDNACQKHGTYEIFPLPLYYFGVINIPELNALWPDTIDGKKTISNHKDCQTILKDTYKAINKARY